MTPIDGAGLADRLRPAARRSGSVSMHGPFLTIAEAATLARVSPKRLRALMQSGVLREGVHFSRPRGLRPRFNRDAVLAWLADAEIDEATGEPSVSHRGRCRVNLELIRRA